MEKLEYEDDTIPQHVANHLRQVAREKAEALLSRSERKHLDDEEMRQIEPGQNF